MEGSERAISLSWVAMRRFVPIISLLVIAHGSRSTPSTGSCFDGESLGTNLAPTSSLAPEVSEDESGAFATQESEARPVVGDGGTTSDDDSNDDEAPQPRCAAPSSSLAHPYFAMLCV